MNYQSKYNDSIKNIKLKYGTLVEVQEFWNALNTSCISTLNANNEMGDYAKLNTIFPAVDILVPPLGHIQRKKAISAYKNYTRVLRDHLLKKETIDKGTSPKSQICLTKNQLNKDRFDMLTIIITNDSPQLDRDQIDLVNYVKELQIQDGEKMVKFYHRVNIMEYEIELQQDKL